MVKLLDAMKRIYSFFSNDYLRNLCGKALHQILRFLININRYKYILIGFSLLFIVLGLIKYENKFNNNTVTLICALISTAATITVGVAALYANNKISETSSSFLQKHEQLLNEAVCENRKQNEIMLRGRIYDELNKYYISIINLHNTFRTEHYPYKINKAICKYLDEKNRNMPISSIEFMDTIQNEIMITTKARHTLMATRFCECSIFDLIIAFDDYMVKLFEISEKTKTSEFQLDNYLCENIIDEYKTIFNEINIKFLRCFNDVEKILNKIDDNAVSYEELSVYLKTLRKNKSTISKRLNEEYAKRNASYE